MPTIRSLSFLALLTVTACGGSTDTPPTVGGGTPTADGSPVPSPGASPDSGSGSPDVPAEGPGGDPTPVTGGGVGWFHTKGAQIVDENDRAVQLTGLSWFGLETANYAPHGLWSRSMASMLDQIKALGYNMIRVPFSSQLLDSGSAPNGIDFAKNPELVGKSGLEIIDALVAGAKARDLRVILDRHRPDSSAQSPLWYTDQYSESRWIDDWKMLATRYRNDNTVIGFDLHNEPHGTASWGDGNAATDWRLAAERAGNAVLAINPHLLIIVEGIEFIDGKNGWWGGNLRNAGAYPVRLNVANQLVYSPHDYPASVFDQTWFSAPDYPANLPAVWDESWGYIARQGIAPIWIGEFGTRNQTASDQKWLSAITAYIKTNQLSFAYWCFNPNSGDTGGILQDDWQTVNTDKQSVLQPLLAPLLK